jgi:succinoglycan biosynthesis protein ExoA
MTAACQQEHRQEPSPSFPATPPFITVIVPVRNEERFILSTLDQLLAQDYDPERFEVLVADGCSTDATATIVRDVALRHPQVHLLDNPKGLSSAGRNAGIRTGRGDLFVIIDGHCDLRSRRYLADLADAFTRSDADCVGRPQPLDVSDATPLQRAIAAARSSRLGHQPDSHIYSGAEGFVPPQSVAVAYRRSVFERVGLFDESFDACEDVELNHRAAQAGQRCFFTPRVAVHYYPRSSLAGLFRQMMRYGAGRVRLLRKHPETFTLPIFVPAVFLLGFLAGPVLAWFSTGLGLVYASALGLYALLIGLACATIARRTADLRAAAWLPLVFLTIHLGAGAGIVREWALVGWWKQRSSRRKGTAIEALPFQRRLTAAPEERRAAA